MTLDVRYHPEALAELRADVSWYDDRGAGLGERFEAAVDVVVDTVLEWPDFASRRIMGCGVSFLKPITVQTP